MGLTLTAASVRALPGALVREFFAGGSGNLGDWVYIAADGDVETAQANTADSSEAVGIVVSINKTNSTSFVAGDKISVAILGPVAGYSGGTPGAPLFLSAATAGDATETAPTGTETWTRRVGYVEAADTIIVMPGVEAPASNS